MPSKKRKPAPLARSQTTMRLRPDLLNALSIEAQKQSREFNVSVSRSRVIENVLIDFVKKRGHKLSKGETTEVNTKYEELFE